MSSNLVSLASITNGPGEKRRVDLERLRQKLAAGGGPAFWRTLEEADEDPAVRGLLEDEFPTLRGAKPGSIDRRNLLKVMGASLAMAGAAACTRQPPEYIVPYVRQPENVLPGTPLFYATAHAVHGYGRGVLVESHLNRPTKVEGNPDHPASLGATSIFEQASVLGLYDPDRSQSVLKQGRLSDWGLFLEALVLEKKGLQQRQGEGLAVLLTSTTSPTLQMYVDRLKQQLPRMRLYQHDPMLNPAAAATAQAATGRAASMIYNPAQADVVVSLESDFLNTGPAALVYSRHAAQRRALGRDRDPWRFYVIESSPSVSGTLADHRFPVQSSAIAALSYQLAAACGVSGAQASGEAPSWLAAVAKDLQAAKGRSLVVPGEFQPESVHRAALAMNQALGNLGATVRFVESVEPQGLATLAELASDINGGHVEILLILGGNPVYEAPGSMNMAEVLRKPRFSVHLSNYYDETSRLCTWHVPEAHYLESWGDVRAFDGTVTIQQPLIAPLYGGKTAVELLINLTNQTYESAHDLVKGRWRNTYQGRDFDDFWETSVHDGVMTDTASAEIKATAGAANLAPLGSTGATGGGIEVVFRPDPTVGAGDWSNNAWLQELPKPQNKLAWDNTFWISPKTAGALQLGTADLAQLTVNGVTIEGPVWVLPGHATDSVTVQFGYGRESAGRVGEKIGYNAYKLQNAAAPFVSRGASLKKTGGRYLLANTQFTQTMEEREPVRVAQSLEEYRQHPDFPTNTEETKPLPRDYTLYPEYEYKGYKWGMVIDLNVCHGCSACVIACQAENNIAVVGKEQVALGRHMHWIRVDRYYAGDLDRPDLYNQPLPCMHCENAPCELVCPVAATVHSGEGINQMVYNRCVGTRYCSNNCPYKVRRFNFYLYSDWQTPSLYGLRNPDVTVRSRGVMEKCTYCLQRIQEAKITAEKENRRVREGEIVTACAQVCPTEAITFGDLNDPNSKVTQLARSRRNYGLLDDLNTRPRTTYLGIVRNTNESLRGASGTREA